MEPILHITTRAAWAAAEAAGEYRADSLASEGFIHCSTRSQVAAVANDRFAGRVDLVLLVIDPAQVAAEVRYEDCYESGQRFPHVYGPLPLAAVHQVIDYRPGDGGRFGEPAA
jgi:uncharacterized protein (DUF952 family)